MGPGPVDDDAVAARLRAVRDRIATAATEAGRAPATVRLVLASKAQPVEAVRAALRAARGLGLPVALGENRVQEVAAKAPALADLAPTIHFIGPLQSNKVAALVPWVECVETVASVELARRLDRRAAATGRRLDVMVQVNVSGEATKHGATPDEALALAVAVAALPTLRLTGLMTVGLNSPDPGAVAAGYAVLRTLRDGVVASGEPGTATATGLSMGMSGDLEIAVAEGATLVRVGSAVFGARPVRGRG